MTKTKQKVIVGISGGVDSAVAALLLKQQGYEVEGCFMQNWHDDEDGQCSAEQDLKDAKQVCATLEIPLHTVNFSKKYWHNVFQHFLDEYAAGRTHNPDILCNKEIKFKAFLNHALELKADLIATGHYVKHACVDGQYKLLKAKDQNKDQTYFLYTLQQQQLQYCLFPLGDLDKTEVRELARQHQLPNHDRKDSTGICFIGERNFKKFLNEYLLAKPGKIITVDGDEIGRHDGLMFYTLGQRQGLGIGGKKNAAELPWYVVQKDIANNVLIVAQQHDHPLLLSRELDCKQLSWISGKEPTTPLSCTAKIRYRQTDQACTLSKTANGIHVEFAKPQRAITPGQSVVFYSGDECLGGGVIF